MRLIVLILIMVSLPSIANDKIVELIESSSPDCKVDVVALDKEIDKIYESHIKTQTLHKIEEMLIIRSVIIDEGAVKAQRTLDKYLVSELSLLFYKNEILEKQRASISRIKETLLTYPLKAKSFHINDLKNKFEEFGI